MEITLFHTLLKLEEVLCLGLKCWDNNTFHYSQSFFFESSK